MFFYGILVDNLKLIIVNVIGFNLEACYIIFFLFFSQNKVNFNKTIYSAKLRMCVS